jgi:hypothetical protein
LRAEETPVAAVPIGYAAELWADDGDDPPLLGLAEGVMHEQPLVL